MKKFAVSLAIGASLVSSVAVAGTQRPTYLAFKAPAAVAAPVSGVVAPATASVAKRDKAIAGVPLIAALLGVVAVGAVVAAVATGDDDKKQSPG